MNPVDTDNLMLALIRDPDDAGTHILWSDQWIRRCIDDPSKIISTLSTLTNATRHFLDTLKGYQQPPSKEVN